MSNQKECQKCGKKLHYPLKDNTCDECRDAAKKPWPPADYETK